MCRPPPRRPPYSNGQEFFREGADKPEGVELMQMCCCKSQGTELSDGAYARDLPERRHGVDPVQHGKKRGLNIWAHALVLTTSACMALC